MQKRTRNATTINRFARVLTGILVIALATVVPRWFLRELAAVMVIATLAGAVLVGIALIVTLMLIPRR